MRTKGIEIILAIARGVIIPSLLVILLQDREIKTAPPSESVGTTAAKAAEDNRIAVLLEDNGVVWIPLEE